MVKLRSDLVRYLTAAELRVLQAVETGMRAYAYVPAAHTVARAWLCVFTVGGGTIGGSESESERAREWLLIPHGGWMGVVAALPHGGCHKILRDLAKIKLVGYDNHKGERSFVAPSSLRASGRVIIDFFTALASLAVLLLL